MPLKFHFHRLQQPLPEASPCSRLVASIRASDRTVRANQCAVRYVHTSSLASSLSLSLTLYPLHSSLNDVSFSRTCTCMPTGGNDSSHDSHVTFAGIPLGI